MPANHRANPPPPPSYAIKLYVCNMYLQLNSFCQFRNNWVDVSPAKEIEDVWVSVYIFAILLWVWSSLLPAHWIWQGIFANNLGTMWTDRFANTSWNPLTISRIDNKWPKTKWRYSLRPRQPQWLIRIFAKLIFNWISHHITLFGTQSAPDIGIHILV